ncbi:MAG: response regulator transcription factor [Clostridia bacterium]|nr:response regulator transcription factor [Clostridia bacterium]
MNSILVVEDDLHISNLLDETLSNEGYKVIRAFSGTEAMLVLSDKKPDLILLDLMLPGLSGEEILPMIKNIPVIVTSAKAETSSKVKLLLSGAADYITKPFEMEELLARITVQLRKKSNADENSSLCVSDLVLNPDTLTAKVNGAQVRLTRTECAILKLLMQTPQRPIGKSTILEKISRDTPDCTERSLKQHISNIRKKLLTAGGRDYIEAVYGIGFKFKS